MNDWKNYMWDDFIKRDELESSPGIIDGNMIRALTLNTYLMHIGEMITDGTAEFPEAVYEHLKMVTMLTLGSYSHVVEGYDPEPEEIAAKLELPETKETLQYLTSICVNSNPEDWPKVMQQLREMLPETDLDRINWDTEERRQNEEKWIKRFEENGGIIEL